MLYEERFPAVGQNRGQENQKENEKRTPLNSPYREKKRHYSSPISEKDSRGDRAWKATAQLPLRDHV